MMSVPNGRVYTKQRNLTRKQSRTTSPMHSAENVRSPCMLCMLVGDAIILLVRKYTWHKKCADMHEAMDLLLIGDLCLCISATGSQDSSRAYE